MNELKQKDFIWIAPILVLILGLLPMPYGYYSMSRIIVCFSSAFIAYKLKDQKNVLKLWVFIALAILYNPILPIHLDDKGLWIAINIPTILLFYLNKNKV